MYLYNVTKEERLQTILYLLIDINDSGVRTV